VALVDSHQEIGRRGVSTNGERLPSKTLRETALALSGLKSRNLYGVDLSLRREVTVADFLGHEEHVKDAFMRASRRGCRCSRRRIYCGTSTFLDAHTIQVNLGSEDREKDPSAPSGEIQLRSEKILIATGFIAGSSQRFSFRSRRNLRFDTILKLDRIPKTLAVVGAGVIGAEYGCTFCALGAEVHILDGRNVLLPFWMRKFPRHWWVRLQRSGIVFHWKENVQKCIPMESGGVRLELSSGAALTGDAVLVAAGRQSNTAKLGLEKVGVKTGERGTIPVNEHFQTNIENIYAAGDVIGFPALASTSMEQARRAVRHALGLAGSAISPLLPNGIYTIPEVGMVGETEESLKKKGAAYIVGRAKLSGKCAWPDHRRPGWLS